MPFIIQDKTNRKLVLIVVVLAVIVGGGILTYQYWWLPKQEVKNVACMQEAKLCPDGSYVGRTGLNCEFSECLKAEDEDKRIVAVKEIEIVLLKDKEWPYQPGDFYYYQIDKDTKIIFISRETEGGSFPNGDVILEKNGNDFILLSDTELFGPGGEAFKVWATNNSDIFLIQFGSGDMGWWMIDNYYLDLTKNKIVFKVSDDQGHNLIVEKDGLPVVHLDLTVIDNCGVNKERTGKKAQIVDLTLNGKTANILEEPIEVDCIDPGGIGPIYNPDFDLAERKIYADFSQFHFALIGTVWENGSPKELWKEEFYIPFTNLNNIKINREPLNILKKF